MTRHIAFDIYGTLIDTHGVVSLLQKHIGAAAPQFSQVWRDKQLEYSFRRGLMQAYEPFSVCTAQALDYTCDSLNVSLSSKQKQALLSLYKVLPAFSDVSPALKALSELDYKLYAFSNGLQVDVQSLIDHAGIEHYLQGIVSVDDLQTFKPNPSVYHYCADKMSAPLAESWLISSNPFDVIGATQAGMKTVWVKRSDSAVFDPWGIEPTVVVASLTELKQAIQGGDVRQEFN